MSELSPFSKPRRTKYDPRSLRWQADSCEQDGKRMDADMFRGIALKIEKLIKENQELKLRLAEKRK